jgi:hypothetical protein
MTIDSLFAQPRELVINCENTQALYNFPKIFFVSSASRSFVLSFSAMYRFFAFVSTSSAASTLLKMPDSLPSDIIDYLPVDERLAIIRDMLPFLGDQLGEQLRVAGGFASVTAALDDFIKYNRPELIEASAGWLELEDLKKTHLRRNMGVIEIRTVPEWLAKVVEPYLWCLSQEFCKYLPSGLRTEEGVNSVRPSLSTYLDPKSNTYLQEPFTRSNIYGYGSIQQQNGMLVAFARDEELGVNTNAVFSQDGTPLFLHEDPNMALLFSERRLIRRSTANGYAIEVWDADSKEPVILSEEATDFCNFKVSLSPDMLLMTVTVDCYCYGGPLATIQLTRRFPTSQYGRRFPEKVSQYGRPI